MIEENLIYSDSLLRCIETEDLSSLASRSGLVLNTCILLCENLTPSHCDPTDPRGSWFKHIFIFPSWGCCNTRLSFSSWSVSEKNVFKDSLFIFLHHDLNKLYATQPENAPTQVPSLRVNWFLRWFLKIPTIF